MTEMLPAGVITREFLLLELTQFEMSYYPEAWDSDFLSSALRLAFSLCRFMATCKIASRRTCPSPDDGSASLAAMIGLLASRKSMTS